MMQTLYSFMSGLRVSQPMTVDYTTQMQIGTSLDDTLAATQAQPIVIGLDGSDTITGTGGDNVLVGDYFNLDYLNANLNGETMAPPPYPTSMQGNDLLKGNAGNDTLYDDLGADTLNGGTGDDRLIVTANDIQGDVFKGGDGTDTLSFSDVWGLGFTSVTASKLVLNGNSSIEYVETNGLLLKGTTGGNTFNFSGVIGFSAGVPLDTTSIMLMDGADRYIAADTALKVDGGAGNDTMSGAGGGWYLGQGGQDSLTGAAASDTLDGGLGADTLNGLGGSDILIGGDAFDTLLGGTGDDSLSGGTGNDSLTGGEGNDTLDGGTGDDTMKGNAGDDTYVIDSLTDVLSEGADGGIDTIVTTLNLYTLPKNFENLTYSGNGSFNGNGTALDNQITSAAGNDILSGLDGNDILDGRQGYDLLLGGTGNDTLLGENGNDTLDGGLGVDHLEGGSGDDAYLVDDASDTVVEQAIGGMDTVYAASDHYQLSDFVEVLVYTGLGAFDGRGNDQANTILGGAGNDTLDGAGGMDTLTGGAGADMFVFSTAPGPGNVDTVTDFTAGIDQIALDGAVFDQLAAGALAATAFKDLSTGGTDASDRILYDPATGKIYYDADGAGGVAEVLFAQVTPGTVLAASDFVVI